MTSKPKYAGLGIALGAALGAVAGVMAGNMGVWLAIGVAIGLGIGLLSRRKSTECPQCEAIHRAHEAAFGARRQL
jgi:F0F1-type ATP synthase assembly protein I